MSNLDYDEIDKAMQSLDGSGSLAPSDGAIADKPQQIEKPKLETVGTPERAPLPSLAGRRSGGRFMDVVHPSSDMRPSSNMTSIKPVDVSPAVPVNNTTQLDQKPIENVAPVPTVLSQPQTNPSAIQEQDDDSDIAKLSDDINKTLGITDKALETPFIPDVSVEKRPLGAFSKDASKPSEENSAKTEVSEDSQPTDMTLNTPLPAELQSDLLSIESSTVAKNTPAETSSVDTEEEKKPVEVEAIETVSVPSQHQEKPKADDQKVSPMYDSAESYNKVLLHPAKNKSWMWIIWIILLIAVGAGIGVAAYFFLLPNL